MMYKKLLLRIVFMLEIVVFGWFYYYGARGVQSVQKLKEENDIIMSRIAKAQTEVEDVERQIVAWNEDSFFTEKMAREELQMARFGDEIYYFDS